jgi:hypothetical protein
MYLADLSICNVLHSNVYLVVDVYIFIIIIFYDFVSSSTTMGSFLSIQFLCRLFDGGVLREAAFMNVESVFD